MFTRIVTVLAIASAFAVSTSGAMAEGGTPDYPQVFESQLSRAEVRQAAIEARSAGQVADGERSVVAELTMGMSQLSRAQVLAELAEARRLRLVPGGERTVVPTAAQAEQIRLAGLRAAMPMVASR